MASAKQTAMNYLGNEDDYINLSGLNTERQNANDVYKTNTTSFQNAYNDLLSTIANNRNKAKTDFGSGRATVNENAFLQNRSDVANLASRGLSGGIAQLSKLGNRMETGRQYSDLANTYYNTLNELNATEKTGTDQFNTNMETAKNTLNAALADIDAREKAGRNQYRAAVAQLAEQIQARWAAQAAAAASRQQATEDAQNQLSAAVKSRVNEILSGKGSDEAKYQQAWNYLKLQGYDATKTLSNWSVKQPSNIYWKATRDSNGKLDTANAIPLTSSQVPKVQKTTAEKLSNAATKFSTGCIGGAVNGALRLYDLLR